MNIRADTVRNKGLDPIILVGNTTGARQCLLGGFTLSGTDTGFKVAAYDVSNDNPQKLYEFTTPTFTTSSAGDCSWALAPDGRFVAMYLKDDTGTPSHRFVIYDTESRQFGSIFSLNLPSSASYKQIAWLDSQHFVMTDANANRRGVRVLARAGREVADLGFYDVWGINSVSTNGVIYYAQFTPIQGGLLYYTIATTATTISYFIRPIYWQNNTLTVGASYTLASSLLLPPGSGSQSTLLRTGDDEWTIYYATVNGMRLMSFRPTAASAIISRPWQYITNSTLGLSTSSHPLVYGDRIVVLQRSSSENIYRLSEITLNAGDYSLSADAVAVTDSVVPTSNFGAYRIDSSRLLVLGITGFDGTLTQLGIIRRRMTGDSLSAIVATLLNRSGYSGSDYDLSALAAISVNGYVLNDPLSALQALAPLQAYARFDLIESDGKLKAVVPTVIPAVTIPLGEVVLRKDDNDSSKGYEIERLQEMDLPRDVVVDYLDASRDYEIGSQAARRLATRGSIRTIKLDLPLVCTANAAKRLAETRLFEAWAEREQITLSLTRRWLPLDPADVIQYDNKRIRITDIRLQSGIVKLRGRIIPDILLNSDALAEVGLTTNQATRDALLNKLYMLDLPLLRAEDDQAGCYVAMSGIAGWPGGSLWRASDGVNFSNIGNFPVAATAGIALEILASASPHYIDRANSVLVQLLQGTLASCTEDDLLNGANIALLGDELIQFQTATLLGPGLYRLSKLLRGRRGTENTITQHTLGEKFIVLNQGSIKFIPALLTDRSRSYAFRGVTVGQNVGMQPDENFTYTLKTLQPLAPVQIRGARVGGIGTDLNVSWVRRARINADWVDYIDVPLDEVLEAYELEIMNGAAVMRTFAIANATTQIYTAAQQTTDWGSVPATFTINLYQMSSRYGRGAKATAIL